MGRKKKPRKKKKTDSFQSTLGDKLSGMQLDTSEPEPIPAPSRPSAPSTRKSGQEPESDVDWETWWKDGEASTEDSTSQEWLDWVGQEVEPLPGSQYTRSKESQFAELRREEESSSGITAQQMEQALAQERATWVQQVAVWQERVAALEAQVATQQQQNDTLSRQVHDVLQETEREKQRSEQYLQERNQARQARTVASAKTMVSFSELLSERGIPSQRAEEALRRLASEAGHILLPLLRMEAEVGKDLLQRHLALCCEHPDCVAEMEASASARALLTVSDARKCENCQGSDNRRAVRRLVRMCREKRRYRLVIVGGSPDAHAEIQRLVPDGFDLKLVNGKDRRNKQQATDDLRYSDLVIVWGPTILPHKISELYTKQKEVFPDRMLVVHKRGVASMARDVSEFLDTL